MSNYNLFSSVYQIRSRDDVYFSFSSNLATVKGYDKRELNKHSKLLFYSKLTRLVDCFFSFLLFGKHIVSDLHIIFLVDRSFTCWHLTCILTHWVFAYDRPLLESSFNYFNKAAQNKYVYLFLPRAFLLDFFFFVLLLLFLYTYRWVAENKTIVAEIGAQKCFKKSWFANMLNKFLSRQTRIIISVVTMRLFYTVQKNGW